jgi:hypothetical protein
LSPVPDPGQGWVRQAIKKPAIKTGFFYAAATEITSPPTLPPAAMGAPVSPLQLTTAILNLELPHR